MSVSVEIYEYLTQVDYKAEDPADEQRLHWAGCEFNEYMITVPKSITLLCRAGEIDLSVGNAGRSSGGAGTLYPRPAGAIFALRPAQLRLCGGYRDMRLFQVCRPQQHCSGEKSF